MAFSRRDLLLGAGAALTDEILTPSKKAEAVGSFASFERSNVVTTNFAWADLTVGGGGFITGLDIDQSSGTMVIRSDVGSGYVGSTTLGTAWTNLFKQSALPFTGPYYGQGCCEVRICQGHPLVMYALYTPIRNTTDGWFVTQNGGATWTLTAATNITQTSNGNNRLNGQQACVSPTNPGTAFLGSASKGFIQFTTNYGVSVSNVSTSNVPAPTTGYGFYGCQFDPSASGNRAVIPSYGNQATVVTGINSTLVYTQTTGGPTSVINGKFDFNTSANSSYYYCIDGNGHVWRLSPANVWLQITSSNTGSSLTCDPANFARVIACSGQGYLSVCVNANTGSPTFGGSNNSFNINTYTGQPSWPNAAQDTFLSVADIQIDASGNLWLAHGDGVFFATAIATSPAAQQYYPQYNGIENLDSVSICASPSGAIVGSAWDRPFWSWSASNPSAPASSYGPNYNGVQNGNSMVDYCSGSTNTFIGMTPSSSKFVFVSANGGSTWSAVATAPFSGAGGGFGAGCCAGASATDFMIHEFYGGNIYHTRDGGTTWTNPGLPAFQATAAGYAGSYTRRDLVADRVNIGDYYYYSPESNGANAGLWHFSQSTQTATQVSTTNFGGGFDGDSYNLHLRPMPGFAGYLVLTTGTQNGGASATHPDINPPNTQFWYSTNGGSTWTAFANITEVAAFGFGTVKSGKTYPSLYIAGYINYGSGYVYGVHQSDDFGSTWAVVPNSAYPQGWYATPIDLDGDKVNDNRIVAAMSHYVYTAGFGWMYYGPGAA